MKANYASFSELDIRVGTVLKQEAFPEAHKPAYKLQVDFGSEIGVLKSSAQLTECYELGDLVGKQVIGIVNFEPRQIGPFISECLVLGIYNEQGVVLLSPERTCVNGEKIG